MIRAIKLSTFIFILSVSAAAGDQGSQFKNDQNQAKLNEALWRDAVGLYTTESADFIDTLSGTLDELRFWREKILADRFEEKITRYEAVLSKSNTEALGELEGYLKKGGIDALDDSLMMRLAQLEYDRANFDMTDKMRRYDGEMNQYQAGSRKDVPVLPAPDYAKTIYYTSELLRKFPNSPLSDKAHYLMGYCLYDEGKADQAEKVYADLVRLHPYSDLAPETHFRLAESYFDNEKYDQAMVHYKILAETNTPFTQKALYKLGATYYARGDYAESVKVFLNLYKTASARLGSADSEAETLYDEAIDYLAHLKVKNVKFEMDEEIDAMVTKRLADVYHRAHNENLSRQTYLHYVASHSISKWSPEFMNKVIESYTDENLLAKAQEVRNNFVKALSPASAYWVKFKNDQTAMLQYEDLYEEHVLASAEFYGEQARRTKRSADYAAAIRFYQKFIDEYSSSPLRVQALFELGELQYFAGKYDDASQSYMKVMDSVDATDYLEESAYGYFLSELKKDNFPMQRPEALRPARNAQGELLGATALNNGEKGFLRAAQTYVDHIPTGGRRQRILYRTAEVFFEHNEFSKTRAALELLLKDKEETSIKISSLRLIAVTYDLENNWEKLVEANRRLVSAPLMADDEDELSDKHSQLPQLNAAWHLEATGYTEEAAGEYEHFAINFPENSESAFAVYHAGILYRKAAEISASDRMFARVQKQYASTIYAPKAVFFRAANLQSMIRFDQAAGGYEDFARKYPRHPLSVQAFFNAGMLRKGMGQNEKAAEDLEEYNRRVNDDEVSFQIAQIYKEAKKFDDAARVLKPYITGRQGKDLFLRSVFTRAMLADDPAAGAAAVRHGEEDCVAVDTSMKIAKGFSARAAQAGTGCAYVKTFAQRNELLLINTETAPPETVDAKFDSLLKEYARVQALKSNDWTLLAMSDAGRVAESLAKKYAVGNSAKSQTYNGKALAFYKKALEIKEGAQARELPEFVVEGLNRLAPDTLVLYDELSYWSAAGQNPRSVAVSFPAEAGGIRGIFDSGKWDLLIDEAGKGIKDGGAPYLFSVKARAQAETGRWKEARATLKGCVDDTKDRDCISSLLQLGYSGNQLGEYRDLLEASLKTENHASWKLGLAQAMARQNHTREALSLAIDAVTEDPKAEAAYSFVAKLFVEAKRPELAKIVLEEGLINSDGDDSLEIQMGHLDLSLRLIQPVTVTVEDFKDQDKRDAGITVLGARLNFIKGNQKEAVRSLENSPAVDSAKSDLVTADFYFALMNHDGKKLDSLKGPLSDFTENNPQASYLLGIYLDVYKHDFSKAKTYMTAARENGMWGRILDVAKNIEATEGAGDRRPAKEKSP